jgi:hypothetical protein
MINIILIVKCASWKMGSYVFTVLGVVFVDRKTCGIDVNGLKDRLI